MSADTNDNEVAQPTAFAFTDENLEKAKAIIAKYPEGRQQSAVMPLLTLAQKQHDNWLPRAAMDYVAEFLDMAPIRVYEVATFYTMYNLTPVGRHHVQICTNLPCWLRGADAMVETCRRVTGVGPGETSEDGTFTVSAVECLCACVNAPIVQIDEDFYEDLDENSLETVLTAFARGEKPAPGSQAGRTSSEPVGGITTLTEFYPDRAKGGSASASAEGPEGEG